MSNHGHRGVLSFRIQISPLCSECPVPCPPQVNSRHMPCASLHAAAPSQCLVIIIIIIINIIIIIIIVIIIIIIRLEIRIFRHPFSKYPTVRWKWQVRASIGTAKRDIGVCANTDRVFFSPHDACVWQCIPPNGYLNGLSDEQPWTSWGALFSDPDISALLWMSSSMPPQVNSRHMPCASLHAAAPSQCLIISIIVIILIIIIIHHHHHHHHSTCDSDFSTSICHVTLTFASKRVKQRNVGASPCFGWTEIFPSFCQSGDLLAHDVHIDKPKAWCIGVSRKGPGRMSAFALSDPPRPLWHNYLSCHPFSSLFFHPQKSCASNPANHQPHRPVISEPGPRRDRPLRPLGPLRWTIATKRRLAIAPVDLADGFIGIKIG